jgi:hypothetical protein
MQDRVLGAAVLCRTDLTKVEGIVVRFWESRELVVKIGHRLDFALMSPWTLAELHAGVRLEASS